MFLPPLVFSSPKSSERMGNRKCVAGLGGFLLLGSPVFCFWGPKRFLTGSPKKVGGDRPRKAPGVLGNRGWVGVLRRALQFLWEWGVDESWMSPEFFAKTLNLGEPWGRPGDGELGVGRKGSKRDREKDRGLRVRDKNGTEELR